MILASAVPSSRFSRSPSRFASATPPAPRCSRAPARCGTWRSSNIATGLVNLLLSALLIRPFGLVGVAVGTLIPIAFSSIFVLFPAVVPPGRPARSEGVPPGRLARRLAGLRGWAVCSRSHAISHPARFWLFCSSQAAAAVLYLALFFGSRSGGAIGGQYVDRLMELMGKNKRLAPAA